MCVYKNDVGQLLRAREREREWRVVYSDTSLSEWGAGLRLPLALHVSTKT